MTSFVISIIFFKLIRPLGKRTSKKKEIPDDKPLLKELVEIQQQLKDLGLTLAAASAAVGCNAGSLRNNTNLLTEPKEETIKALWQYLEFQKWVHEYFRKKAPDTDYLAYKSGEVLASNMLVEEVRNHHSYMRTYVQHQINKDSLTNPDLANAARETLDRINSGLVPVKKKTLSKQQQKKIAIIKADGPIRDVTNPKDQSKKK
ncbi:hypothetical protein [Paraflavitalea sp. CAU 1676]|uniref:hypothetical protein n=1 Tax=Paraflavitalea sp. CAU 1676 TaxID=3032598 RepID=UPI0023DCEA13|nr:hypothetical protein [Paraflavitalea sp. CAU 1676]MDF2192417.1 hypothetical protein [Paraflavitalea sp. CAU 1676]